MSTSDWITIGDIKKDEGDLLADGKTRSRFITSVINITTTDNSSSGAQDRTGKVVVSANGKDYEISVTQMGGSFDIDFTKAFRRKSLMIRFTATWCGYCPMMGEAVEEAVKMYPDHIVPMYIHASNSNGGMAYEKAEEFERLYKVSGYPTGAFNSMVTFGNQPSISDTKEAIVNLAKEAVSELPSNTSIAGVASVLENEIILDLSLAAKTSGEYNLCAFLLEDGKVYKQSNGGRDYVHDYITRKDFCGTSGSVISLTAQQIVQKTLSMTVPKSVEDLNNCHVVVYLTKNITKDETFTGHVKNMFYENFGSYVDNVCNIPINGFSRFLYED